MITLIAALILNVHAQAPGVAEIRLKVQRCMDRTNDDAAAQTTCFKGGSHDLAPYLRDLLRGSFQDWSDGVVRACNAEANSRGQDVDERYLVGVRCYYRAAVHELNQN